MRRRGGTRPVLWLVSASPTPAGPLRFMLDHSAMVMIVHVTWVRSTLHGRYASELAIMQAQHRNRPHEVGPTVEPEEAEGSRHENGNHARLAQHDSQILTNYIH